MNDTIDLITTIASGSQIKKKKGTLFCIKRSVKRSEFYAAFAAGQKPQYEFEVGTEDYQSLRIRDPNSGKMIYPCEAKHDGESLTIIRAYTDGNKTFLTCG